MNNKAIASAKAKLALVDEKACLDALGQFLGEHVNEFAAMPVEFEFDDVVFDFDEYQVFITDFMSLKYSEKIALLEAERDRS